jgi:hypothetical protein
MPYGKMQEMIRVYTHFELKGIDQIQNSLDNLDFKFKSFIFVSDIILCNLDLVLRCID